jgi:radical SAM protein with 4Fe4S-binding SPASM domain
MLSQIQTRTAELCDGHSTIDEIVKSISAEFNISSEESKKNVNDAFDLLNRQYAIKWRERKKRRKTGHKSDDELLPPDSLRWNAAQVTNNYSAPLSVIWDLTYECNLKCKHCLVGAGSPMGDELSTEEITGIIDQLVEMKVFSITFSGGEPLLRKDFFDILNYASARNLGIKLSTNGLLVTDRVIKRLDDIRIFAVQISVDGMEKTHDTFRGGKGAYRKAVNALEKLVAAGYWTIVSAMITKYNRHEIRSILEKAISLGVATFKLSAFIPTGRGSKNITRLSLSMAETKDLALEMRELQDKYRHKIQFDIEGTYCWLLDAPPNNLKLTRDRAARVGCSAGRSQLVISPNGNVLSCPFLCDFVVGDLRKDKVTDIWRDAEILKQFRNITKGHLKGKCKDCEYVPNQCQGGCRAAAYVASGDIYGGDPFCWRSE